MNDLLVSCVLTESSGRDEEVTKVVRAEHASCLLLCYSTSNCVKLRIGECLLWKDVEDEKCGSE